MFELTYENIKRVDSGVLEASVSVTLAGRTLDATWRLYRVIIMPLDSGPPVRPDCDSFYWTAASHAIDNNEGPLLNLDIPQFKGLYVVA